MRDVRCTLIKLCLGRNRRRWSGTGLARNTGETFPNFLQDQLKPSERQTQRQGLFGSVYHRLIKVSHSIHEPNLLRVHDHSDLTPAVF